MMFTLTENYGLTYDERERVAYANGDAELAGFYAGLDDADVGANDNVQNLEGIVEELETDLRYLNKAFDMLEAQYDELKVKYDALTARLAA